MSPMARMNGKFMLFNKAQLSIEGQGYQFSDGIHEVISLTYMALVDLGKHVKRLE